MKQEINPQECSRAEAFSMWMSSPQPMVTVVKTFEVGRLRKISRKTGIKFNVLLCWCICKAASSIDEFYLLPEPGHMYRYDKLAVNVIVQNAKGGITFCDVPYSEDIRQFNADYLRSIKIFNWKTIMMNLLYELNGISPIPDIRLHLSLSDEIIDARLSTLILNTIIADDMEVDDSFYSFSNEEYSEALKRMELRKYGAKAYETAGSAAIQNPTGTPLDIMNSVSTAATLNEITTTITRGLYEIAGTSGSTGITKTTLSASLLFESNFIHELLFAIMRPFIRALLSPQIMLLFCINLDVMGLVNLQELGQRDYSLICDFIFRKMSGIIKKLIIFIKDKIILYLLDILKRKLKELIDQVLILMLLEQLNDYIRLLNQIIECLARFSIGRTITGIDDVNYADIIPEKTSPGDPPLPETT